MHVHDLDLRRIAEQIHGGDVLRAEAIEPKKQDLRLIARPDIEHASLLDVQIVDAAQHVDQPLRAHAVHAAHLAYAVRNDVGSDVLISVSVRLENAQRLAAQTEPMPAQAKPEKERQWLKHQAAPERDDHRVNLLFPLQRAKNRPQALQE